MAEVKSTLYSALYDGLVMHHRFIPKRHRFIYRVFACCLDLDELPLLQRLKLFSVNRFNLFSFHEKDHGQGKDQLASSIRQLLENHGYGSAGHRLQLLCYPRILGYAFNPLSVYFCYNSADQLEVVLYEVSNTFGQRHTYLLPVSGDPALVRQHCSKLLYVSPFMPMATAYSFRIQPPGEKVAVCIRQSALDQQDLPEQAILHATFTGQRKALSDRALLARFLRYPLMTLKVIGAIHWEALRLWRKKLSIQPRPTHSGHSISWQDKNGDHHYESL